MLTVDRHQSILPEPLGGRCSPAASAGAVVLVVLVVLGNPCRAECSDAGKLLGMPGIIALRKRMPLIVFLLLALLLLMLVGLVCACLSDSPIQAIERALTALSQLPTVVVAWTMMFATIVLASPRLQPQRAGRGRTSPAALQRFLF